MKTKILASIAVFGLLGIAVGCYAGPSGLFSSPPTPAPVTAWRVGPQAVSLTVGIDPSIDTPHLAVPRSLLVTTAGARGSASPIVIGLAMTSSLVVGGFWAVGRARRRVVAAAGAMTLLAIGTGVVWADLPRPFGVPSPSVERGRLGQPKLDEVELPASISLPKSIRLTIVDTGDSLRLSLPPSKPAPDAKPTKTPAPIAISKPRPVPPRP